MKNGKLIIQIHNFWLRVQTPPGDKIIHRQKTLTKKIDIQALEQIDIYFRA